MPNAAIYREDFLVKEIASGNEIAFGELFNLYRAKLYSFIFRISGSKEIAEDVVQDVFTKIWLNRVQLAGVQHFNSYLFRVAYNHILNVMKRMAKEKVVIAKIQQHSNYTLEEPYGPIDYNELNHLLRATVEALPQRQKIVFLLSQEQGMKQEEISRQLDISVVTVKSHMTQAYLSIRNKLKKAYLTHFISIVSLLLILKSIF